MEHQIQTKHVSRETLDYINALIQAYEKKLSKYVELLMWWNEKINLLSRNITKEEIEKHVIHSLMISVSSVFPKEKVLVDIGSGGGLPGIPLAICSKQTKYILLDRVAKKTAAASDMISQLGVMNTTTVTKELRMFHVEHPVSWISKHAVKIDDFIDSVGKQKWEKAYFLKGDDFESELSGVKIPLNILVYELDSMLKDKFYTGKRLLVIKRGDPK